MRPFSWWFRGGATFVLLGPMASCDAAPRTAADAERAPIVLGEADVHPLPTVEAVATVQDLEALDDGSVWVLNSVEPLFVGFGPDGSLLRMHGSQGGGPDEFGAPSGFVAGGLKGEAWVIDRQRHAIIEVSRPSAERTEIPLPREAMPAGSLAGGMNLLSDLVRTATLGDEILIPQKSQRPPYDFLSFWRATWSADLVALQPGTDSVRQVLALGQILGDPLQHVELGPGTAPFPLWFRPWAVCGDEIRLYDHLQNSVRRFTASGAELDAIALPPLRFTEVTPEQFARVVFDLAVVEAAGAVTTGISEMPAADSARILRGIIQRVDATPRQLADVLPRYVDLRCADGGAVWIRPLDLEMGGLLGGPAWLRIGRDGSMDEVHFPDRFDPYRFTADRIWGVRRDELDVATVAWVSTPAAR